MFQQASTHYEYNKQLQKPWCEGHWARVIESCLLRFFGTRQCPSTVVMTLFSTVSLYLANRTLLSWDGEDDFDQRTHDCKTESLVSLPVVEAFLDISILIPFQVLCVRPFLKGVHGRVHLR